MSQALQFRAQIIRGAVPRGVVHYGCDCNLKISGVGEFPRYAAALVAAAAAGNQVQACQKSDPIKVPENWLYMAMHARSEMARAYWRKKCEIIETES
ncbi:hypothetical protein [Kitasatospora mediocidica]|uniref:hypothetical protein n=1 Tax=Kitasatospora mediocidica TaxID=58352 RepID=UPI0012F8D41B|nr:hypothetical protein [Kitasatospora mediocidica]